ncbi:MAG: YoaK family protein [Solirubrobacteraceae bacterium]
MSRRAQSDLWLLGLAFAGGVVDATSYLGLGHVFTANMTGNTVLLTVALARGSGAGVVRSAVALGGFALGVALAATLRPAGGAPWPGRARRALLLEALALTGLLVIWVLAGVSGTRHALIALAGVAMGAQSAAVQSSDVSGVNTTFMTSTFMNAVEGVIARIRRSPRARSAPGNVPAAAWVIYGLGALAGAFTVRAWHAGVVGVPLVIVAIVTIDACAQNRVANKRKARLSPARAVQNEEA